MSTNLIAISSGFLEAFANLPRQKQGRVLDFMSRFRANPGSPGINYERIRNAYDPNMHSVRIDDTYRAVVVRQEETGVCLLLWVDHHDRAYEWACRKRCKVNPTTGIVQVFDVREETCDLSSQVDGRPLLFRGISDENLLRLGVPEEKLEETRAITALEELYELKSTYPEDAYEGLELIAHGFSVDEVLDTLFEDSTPDEEIKPDDFVKALTHPGSLKSFVVVDDDDELRTMLAAPLERWRVFLHPTQRKIVTRFFNGPARVTGGAGTGKTVVAMHRAKWLAGQIDARDKILFTTFTQNLAADIQENLRKICTPDELKRIEVTNLDRWVVQFLQEMHYGYRVVYGEELDGLWEQAIASKGASLEFDMRFYQDEWSKIVYAHEAFSLTDYLKVSRQGRGLRLDRRKRVAVWQVFEEYRRLCNERCVRDAETAMFECRQLIAAHHDEPLYAAIIVDEGQDLSMSAFRLLRTMAGPERPNDLFIVGDAHQRIYRHHAVLSHCGINTRGRSRYLRINYRTTEEIRRWAFGLLRGIAFDDLDTGYDDGRQCRSLTHGPNPIVRSFDSLDDEFTYVLEQVEALAAQGTPLRNICIVARTNRLLDEYVRRLLSAGIRTYEIKRSKTDDRSFEGVRLATMHRVKGLEFDHVFIVAVNKDIVPHRSAVAYQDEVAVTEAMTAERCLLYVALTRAKQTACVTSHGPMSEFVSEVGTLPVGSLERKKAW